MRRCVIAALLLTATTVAGCKNKPSTLLLDAAPPPTFTDKKPLDAAVEVDEAWSRALQGDPLDLAALADREGALGLLVGVEQGGALGVTALHALPYADDADLALQRLGEIAIQTEGSVQLDVVDVVERITARPPRQAEVLDAPGARACGAAMLEIAGKRAVQAQTRSRAISSLRFLADRLVVDPKLIPTDLDEN